MKVKYTGKSIYGVFANMESLTNNKEYEVLRDYRENCQCVVVSDDLGKEFAMSMHDCILIEN